MVDDPFTGTVLVNNKLSSGRNEWRRRKAEGQGLTNLAEDMEFEADENPERNLLKSKKWGKGSRHDTDERIGLDYQ